MMNNKMTDSIDDLIGYIPDINNESSIKFSENTSEINQDYCDPIRLDKKIIYKIIDFKIPYHVYYVDENLNQICYGELDKDSKIHPLKSVINIVPIKIVYYNNPIFPKMDSKIQLEFYEGFEEKEKTSKIGPCNNISELVKILENRGYILYKNKASDAFNTIVNAMKEKGYVKYVNDVTTAGYYLLEDNLIKKDITQKSSEISKEEAELCCQFLDKLASEDGGWKNKNIFPTVLKWGIIAPFSFSIKQVNKNGFLPWLMLYGESTSGKSTLGEIVYKIWRIKDDDKGFTSIDTYPRLGQIISQNTYPVLINEVGALSASNGFGKYTGILEMMKNSVTGITARSKFSTYLDFMEIPALSPLILTSNHKVIDESGFLRRFIVLHFPVNEKKSLEEQENFKKLNLEILGILGDFVSQNISIDILKKDWKITSVELLKSFYKLAGRDTTPEWINLFEEQQDIEDESREKKYLGLRAFIIEEITRYYSLNNRAFSSDADVDINKDLFTALNFCLKNKLIPYLHQKNDDIIITIDIMQKINIPNIAAFKDISSIIGFEYTVSRIGEGSKTMKVLKGSREDFCKFLEFEI